jgi:uncharacterized integral membrane protein
MRIARFLIAYSVVSILGVLVSLFLAQNTRVEQVTFFGQDFSTNLAWIMLAATTVGFLFALLLLLPGRVAASLHIWSLRREARELDEELAWQSEQRDELLAHHERLLDGHDRLLSVYHRARGELDQAIKERDALKVRLAGANDALAEQKKLAARREIIIPAPPRPASDSTPTAPRIRIAPKVPAIVALDEVDELEDDQEMEAALPVATPALSAPFHSSSSFGAAVASGMRQFTGRLNEWSQASSAWSRSLDERSRDRVEQTATHIRQFASSMRDQLKDRVSGVGARADESRRVSPATHPK